MLKLRLSLIVSLLQLFYCNYLERVYAPGCTEGLRVDIENITVTLLRRKQDLYRQHGLLSNVVIEITLQKQQKHSGTMTQFCFRFTLQTATRQGKERGRE